MARVKVDEENVVHLRGRVSAVDEPRELPSGDWVLTFRLVVRRPPAPSRAGALGARGRPTQVDTIDVACWSASTRRVAGRLTAQDVVEVDGALRRRFFRAGGAATSRYEVEAGRLRRFRQAATA